MAFYIELNTILAVVLKPNEKTNLKKEKMTALLRAFIWYVHDPFAT